MKRILLLTFLVALMFALTVPAIAEIFDCELESPSTVFEFVIYQESEMDTTEKECADIGVIVDDYEANKAENVVLDNDGNETEIIIPESEAEETNGEVADTQNNEKEEINEEIADNDETDEQDVNDEGQREYSDAMIVAIRAAVAVRNFSESQSELVIVITHEYHDGTENVMEEAFIINNNAAARYNVGEYVVYVDIKGDNVIRACYIVK